jgi:hypothetical protein
MGRVDPVDELGRIVTKLVADRLLGMDAVLVVDAVAAQFPAVTKTYDMWQVV